jgi:hypothetical protein
VLDPITRRRYCRALGALREECPLLLPVRVRISYSPPPQTPDGRLIAWAYLGDGMKCFRIVLRTSVYEHKAPRPRAIYPSELLESLAHEWAHCMAWRQEPHDLIDHCPLWGVAYAQCYRTVIED